MTSGIIIRLQNLPWNANAEDIRRFFDNLIIPDGGVHIIGGERGDAFIVFGSDEDARQAMLKDGGTIKNTSIKLLLSSRTEMQKVIETAKQQAMTPQNIFQTLATAAAAQQFNPAALQQLPMLPQIMQMFPALRNLATMPNMPVMPGMPPFPSMPGMPTLPGMTLPMPGNMMPQQQTINTNDKNATPVTQPSMLAIPGMQMPMTANPAVTSSLAGVLPNMPIMSMMQPNMMGDNRGMPAVAIKQEKADSKSAAIASAGTNANKASSRSRSRSRSRERRSNRDRYGKRERSRERESRKYRRSRSRSRDRYRKRSSSRDRKSREPTRTRDRVNAVSSARDNEASPKTEMRKVSADKDNRVKPAVVESGGSGASPPKYEENGAAHRRRNGPSRFDAPLGTTAEDRDFSGPPVTRNYETNKHQDGGGETRRPSRFDDGTYESPKYGGGPRNANNYDEQGGHNRNAYGNQENDSYPRKMPYNKRPYVNACNFDNYDDDDGNYEYKNQQESSFDNSYENSFPAASSHNFYAGNCSGPRVSNSNCVEVRDIPWMTNEHDIKKFFSPLPIFDSSIKFKNDKFGRSRSVLVKFVNAEQKDQALQKNGYTITGQRVSVHEIPSGVWEATEKGAPAPPRPQEPYIKLSFIPKRATRENIAAIFANAPEQLVVSKETNRESLVAYAKCASLDDAETLLRNKTNALICDSRVKIEPIVAADFETGQKNVVDPYAPESSKPEEDTAPSYSIEYPPKRPRITPPLNDRYHYHKAAVTTVKSTCCLLKNLPAEVTDKEIVDFFDDVNILPQQIHIMFNANYKQTGESYCEFRNEADAEVALRKNHAYLRDRPVLVELIPKTEVTKAIGGPKLLPPMVPPDQLNKVVADETDVDAEESKASENGELVQSNTTDEAENAPEAEKTEEESTQEQTKEELPSLFSQQVRPPKPYGNPRYPPSSYPESGYLGHRGGRGPHPYAPRHPPPGPRKPFGAPGCVVCLTNVPYRAEVADILELFADFRLVPENVIRRYNEWGQVTGDARVAFQSPLEAKRAIENFNGCVVKGRPITMSLL